MTNFVNCCNGMLTSSQYVDEYTSLHRSFKEGMFKIFTRVNGCDGLEDTILYEGPDESKAEKAWDSSKILYQYVQISDFQNIEPIITILETGSLEDIKWDIQYDVKKWETLGGEVIPGDVDLFEFHLNESDGSPKYTVYLCYDAKF